MDRFLAAYDALLARWPVPVESVDLPTSYGRTRVNSCGPADAPPLVLLPGGGATSTVWLHDVARLSAGHRVHAVDTLGQIGRSVPGARLRRAEDVVRWLGEVLDGVGAGSAALCGHSYGAWMALRFALDAPERVRGAVLLDPTRCFGGYRFGYLLRAAPLLLRPSETRLRRFLAWETSGAAVDAGWLEVAAAGTAAFGSPRGVDPRPPAPEALRRLDVPLLVVLAGRSRAHDVAAIAERVRDRAPRARLHLLPAATHHTLPLAHAEEIDPLVLDFLA